jgi:hypothetical protein
VGASRRAGEEISTRAFRGSKIGEWLISKMITGEIVSGIRVFGNGKSGTSENPEKGGRSLEQVAQRKP